MAKRLQAMGQARYQHGFEVSLHADLLDLPLKWRLPRRVFVNSMSDLFHESVPLDFIQKVFRTMALCPRHTFQVLTKRASRLSQLDRLLTWTDNIWAGVTVESADYVARIDALRRTSARVKFLSLEPLLGPLPRLDLSGIDWVIVGGESGPGARAMNTQWALEIRDQCLAASVPFFFKQWGGTRKNKSGRLLEGRIWDQLPQAYHKVSDMQGARS
jgi:protein gp37